MQDDFFAEALNYHSLPQPGKIGISLTKPVSTQKDLSLTYTPGVGFPCMEINKNKDNVWKYTNRGNTVAIITDGTAVLGLGDIGPGAGLPVMEGKAVLFKKFADIDAYPLCMQFDKNLSEDEYTEKFKQAVECLEPCLGGINLEDVGAPCCFKLQSDLDKKMGIPVFHDDQDGTGIIITAGIMNALELGGKKVEEIQILINGAGAAGIACAKLLLEFGVRKSQIFLCDSGGLITLGRKTNQYKQEFAQDVSDTDLAGAIKGKDVFIGVSVGGVLSQDMVRSMNANPIVFAVANPIPEIMPADAIKAGAFVAGSGRSDFENQVNNSLGFPGIFRAALDTRSYTINQSMKIAASKALASLTKEPVSGNIKEILIEAYPEDAKKGLFDKACPLGRNYVIPKQFDLRVVPRVAKYVAEAAMKTGVAKVRIENLDAYEKTVFDRIKKNWT